MKGGAGPALSQQGRGAPAQDTHTTPPQRSMGHVRPIGLALTPTDTLAVLKTLAPHPCIPPIGATAWYQAGV